MDADVELLLAWQAGDRAAGSRLLERYFEPLYCFFRTKVASGIDELIQETLVTCVEARDRLREAHNFRAFVFGVARNQLFAHFRRQRRAQAFDPGAESVADLGSSPSALVVRRAEQRLLARALGCIPLDHQIALELFYWEDMSGAELATVLGVPEGTIRTRLRRARALLSEQMRALAETADLAETTRADLERWVRSLRDRARRP